jgi:hypothetical protein
MKRSFLNALPQDLVEALTGSDSSLEGDRHVRRRTPIQIGQGFLAHWLPRAIRIVIRAFP